MNVLPQTRDEWVALPLVPFKAWVLIAFPFYLCCRAYAIAHHLRGTGIGYTVFEGYVLSVAVLLFGAIVQSIACTRGAATRTTLFALLGIVLIFRFF